jgi:addiction module HigA family antidote
MKNPPRPGDLIKTEIIEPLGLSVTRAAEVLKVRRATLSDLLNGKSALTPEMALRVSEPQQRLSGAMGHASTDEVPDSWFICQIA